MRTASFATENLHVYGPGISNFVAGDLRRPEDFIHTLLTHPEGLSSGTSAFDIDLVIAGGYPEAVRRSPERAGRWFDSYATRLADHDASQLHQGGYADQVGALMSLLAAGGMQEVVKARLAPDLNVAQSTADAYLRMLRTMRQKRKNDHVEIVEQPRTL